MTDCIAAKIHIYSDICKEIEEKVIVEGFFYLTRPLLLGEVPPSLLNPPLLRRGLQPVNRLFCTRKQAHAPTGLLVIIYAIKLRLFYFTQIVLYIGHTSICGTGDSLANLHFS